MPDIFRPPVGAIIAVQRDLGVDARAVNRVPAAGVVRRRWGQQQIGIVQKGGNGIGVNLFLHEDDFVSVANVFVEHGFILGVGYLPGAIATFSNDAGVQLR